MTSDAHEENVLRRCHAEEQEEQKARPIPYDCSVTVMNVNSEKQLIIGIGELTHAKPWTKTKWGLDGSPMASAKISVPSLDLTTLVTSAGVETMGGNIGKLSPHLRTTTSMLNRHSLSLETVWRDSPETKQAVAYKFIRGNGIKWLLKHFRRLTLGVITLAAS
jgi:hypothetical protein